MTSMGISFAISAVMIALGTLLFAWGRVLVIKHRRIAGILVTTLELGVMAVPVVTFLYIAAAMR